MAFKPPHIIDLPRLFDPRGSLTFVEDNAQIPFDISRVYWVYDVPSGAFRGGHSHHRAEELIVATSGSFTVHLTDGIESMDFPLCRPYQGLYVPPGYWRTLDDFSSGSVCMVLTSIPFSEDDYIRDIKEFQRLVKAHRT